MQLWFLLLLKVRWFLGWLSRLGFLFLRLFNVYLFLSLNLCMIFWQFVHLRSLYGNLYTWWLWLGRTLGWSCTFLLPFFVISGLCSVEKWLGFVRLFIFSRRLWRRQLHFLSHAVTAHNIVHHIEFVFVRFALPTSWKLLVKIHVLELLNLAGLSRTRRHRHFMVSLQCKLGSVRWILLLKHLENCSLVGAGTTQTKQCKEH